MKRARRARCSPAVPITTRDPNTTDVTNRRRVTASVRRRSKMAGSGSLPMARWMRKKRTVLRTMRTPKGT